MKKIILFLVSFFLFIGISFAYTPDDSELKALDSLNQMYSKKAKFNWELWTKKQIYLFENLSLSAEDEKTKYILDYILTNLRENFESLKKENEIKLQEQLALIEKQKAEELKFITDYKTKAKSFFDLYWSQITTSLNVSENCTKHFDFIDEIAKKNNFPTELVIATWSKEYNCNLWNPANWWWPFQITSQYYKPGEVSLEEFWISIQKYIDFTKGKWDYFNNNKYHNYKTRFWNENINITYDYYSIRDLKLSSILYNWVSSNTTLDWNTFANSNLNNTVITNSDWLVTRFLKILNWRVNNK